MQGSRFCIIIRICHGYTSDFTAALFCFSPLSLEYSIFIHPYSGYTRRCSPDCPVSCLFSMQCAAPFIRFLPLSFSAASDKASHPSIFPAVLNRKHHKRFFFVKSMGMIRHALPLVTAADCIHGVLMYMNLYALILCVFHDPHYACGIHHIQQARCFAHRACLYLSRCNQLIQRFLHGHLPMANLLKAGLELAQHAKNQIPGLIHLPYGFLHPV